MNSKQRIVWATCAVLFGILTQTAPARADYTLGTYSSSEVNGVIGMAAWGGCATEIPTICLNTGRAVNLLVGAGCTGHLDSNVVITGTSAANHIWMITASGSPGYCGITNWDPIQYGGYYLDIYGAAGDDELEGAPGSGDTWVHGDAGNDLCYNYSSIGELYGSDGNDDLISDTTGSSDALSGENNSDCLWDTSNSVLTNGFDCGADTNDLYQVNNASIEMNCEHSTNCCGVC